MTDNGNRDELLIDLDAFAPPAGRPLRFQGRTYSVRNFQDIPTEDVFLILRAEQELTGKSVVEQLELSLRYMAILVPEMDRAVLGRFSVRQILRVLQEAMGAAEIPPVGGDGLSDSPIASPSPPASTAGRSESSAG